MIFYKSMVFGVSLMAVASANAGRGFDPEQDCKDTDHNSTQWFDNADQIVVDGYFKTVLDEHLKSKTKSDPYRSFIQELATANIAPNKKIPTLARFIITNSDLNEYLKKISL